MRSAEQPSVRPEDCVTCHGTLALRRNAPTGMELMVSDVSILGRSEQPHWRPRIGGQRWDASGLRHLGIRTPRILAAMKARAQLLQRVRDWFNLRGYLSIDTPILTLAPLYPGKEITAILGEQEMALTQCAGFYLEAAVHAYPRVYNIGPSFRGEESRSRRHLAEYWHIKAELAFVDRENLITEVELFLTYILSSVQHELAEQLSIVTPGWSPWELAPPFPRITYREALDRLQEGGKNSHRFGQTLGSTEMRGLAEGFGCPFWIESNPVSAEPWIYKQHPVDGGVTLTADLVLPGQYGELCGVAEKEDNLASFDQRRRDAGLESDTRYDFLRDVRVAGSMPHGGIGMGFERLIRWLARASHVRKFTLAPREFGRRVRV